jgi:hypothetical protein
MSPRAHRCYTKPPAAIVTLLLLTGGSSIGDFGRLEQPVVADNIHAWVG